MAKVGKGRGNKAVDKKVEKKKKKPDEAKMNKKLGDKARSAINNTADEAPKMSEMGAALGTVWTMTSVGMVSATVLFSTGFITGMVAGFIDVSRNPNFGKTPAQLAADEFEREMRGVKGLRPGWRKEFEGYYNKKMLH